MSSVDTVQNNFDRVPKCGAKTKNGGHPCPNPAMPNGRCRFHGGKTPTGSALPQFNRRRYHNKMPIALLESYEMAVSDPEILNLSEEIAVLQARIGQLLGNVVTGESGLLHEEILKVWKDGMAARRRRDSATWAEKLDEMGALLKESAGQRAVWQEIFDAIDLLRKVQQREQRRRVEMNAMLTSEQAVGFMAELVDLIKQEVTDETALANIHKGMRSILMRRQSLHSAAASMQQRQESDVVEGEIIDIEVEDIDELVT